MLQTPGDGPAVLGDESQPEPPAAPESIAESGLNEQFLLDFVLKAMYQEGHETLLALSERVALSPLIVDAVLETAKSLQLLEILGLADAERSLYRYALTDSGRQRAADALQRCSYVGPAPVPMAAYRERIARQTQGRERIGPAAMERALAHLVLAPDMIEQLGPSVNADRSVLLYGAPGNGKTSIAEALGNGFSRSIFVPHAIEADGQIIRVFDAALHEVVEAEEDGADPRWVRCRRPTLVAGGELTIEMLDLRYDPISKSYEAPAHMKATGGVFIVDDFGRQRVPPVELLNRWIIPLERRMDFLTLHTGRKLEVPFDTLVVFSTNLPPGELMDDAALRRIPYKFHVGEPSRDEYLEILQRVCTEHRLPWNEAAADYLLETFYPKSGLPVSRAHPRFIAEHLVERCRFSGRAPTLDPELVRDAAGHLLVDGSPPPLT